jgi:hypothetical protein
MFESSSRYNKVATRTAKVADATGQIRTISYKLRRELPGRDTMATLGEHLVRQDERLDNITARYLADPTQFWQLCDANVVQKPADLTARSGRLIKVPLPGMS